MFYLTNQGAQKSGEHSSEFITISKGHSRPKLFKCAFCNKNFKERKYLLVHERRHTNDFKSRCMICNKGAPSKSRLAAHILSHTDLRLYECFACPKQYKHKHTRDQHMKRIHNIHHATRKNKVKIVLITMKNVPLSSDLYPDVTDMPLNFPNMNPKDAELLESFNKFVSGQSFEIIRTANTLGSQPNSTGPMGGSTELNELSNTNTWNFTFNDTKEKHKLFNHIPISINCLT